jgi:hypothetical protein
MTALERYEIKQHLTHQLAKQANALTDAVRAQANRAKRAVGAGKDEWSWLGRKSKYRGLADEVTRVGKKAKKMGEKEIAALTKGRSKASLIAGATGGVAAGGVAGVTLGSILSRGKKKEK